MKGFGKCGSARTSNMRSCLKNAQCLVELNQRGKAAAVLEEALAIEKLKDRPELAEVRTLLRSLRPPTLAEIRK